MDKIRLCVKTPDDCVVFSEVQEEFIPSNLTKLKKKNFPVPISEASISYLILSKSDCKSVLEISNFRQWIYHWGYRADNFNNLCHPKGIDGSQSGIVPRIHLPSLFMCFATYPIRDAEKGKSCTDPIVRKRIALASNNLFITSSELKKIEKQVVKTSATKVRIGEVGNFRQLSAAFRVKINSEDNLKWFKTRCSDYRKYKIFKNAIDTPGKRGGDPATFNVLMILASLYEIGENLKMLKSGGKREFPKLSDQINSLFPYEDDY